MFFFSTSGFGAITGLTAYPTTVTYAAVQGNTTKLTDSAPLILAAGSGNATLTISTSGATADASGQGCGTVTWLTASLTSNSVIGGATVGVTISVNPTCLASPVYTGTVKVATAGSSSVSAIITVNFKIYQGTEANFIGIPTMPLGMPTGASQTFPVGLSVNNGGQVVPNPTQDTDFAITTTMTNGSGWLTAAKNGIAGIAFTVNAANLPAGIYEGVIYVSGQPDGAPYGIYFDVGVTVTAPSTPVPTITSLTPSSTAAGGGSFTMTVNGSGFQSSSIVQWNGAGVTTGYSSSSSLFASIPGNLIASQGTANVTVFTSGVASNAVTFTITAPGSTPAITSLSPSSITAGSTAFTMAVNGSGFVSGSVVQWNGFQVSSAYVSSTQLNASILANLIASQGTAAITVVNSGAPTSNAVTFTVTAAAPTISSVSPSSITAGGAAFPLTVTGSGFVSGSVVQWNGSGVSTSYVNATQLTASITANLIASPGTANVTVLNPGVGTSSAVPFVVNAASVTPNVQTISHIADGGGWRSTIILANTDVVAAMYTVNFWSDAGTSYTPPLTTGTTSGAIPVGGSAMIQTPDMASNLSEGWAEVTSSQLVGGTAIFRLDASGQEAAVPLLTSGGAKLEIPYQVGNGLALGVALANPGATQTANITEVIRDQNGNSLASRTFTLGALSHTAFNPTFPNGLSGSGVVEYNANVNLFGLGIRANNGAFTSLDAVLPQPASTKTISHIADGGGWRSIIVLVNTDSVPASYTVNFWSDAGAVYSPQLVLGTTSGTLAVGGSTTIETPDAAPNLSEGWAEVVSSQSIGGTAIFRLDASGQEAAVPLLTTGGAHLEIPYQVGNGLALGVALANPSATQTANITEVIRDQNGNQLASRTFTLGALSHTAFNPTFPNGLSGSGVVEYDANVSLFGLGIRANSGAFTSLRAVYK